MPINCIVHLARKKDRTIDGAASSACFQAGLTARKALDQIGAKPACQPLDFSSKLLRPSDYPFSLIPIFRRKSGAECVDSVDYVAERRGGFCIFSVPVARKQARKLPCRRVARAGCPQGARFVS
ncbi:hypothetical protein [Paraburkholderia tropica]|uniref:hypothetical protein n=1 Tax=Paraburkholderia tropica TaxID=92647 RepID=UPI001CC4AE90|nr:hypothetical protein [Paraburkholderia tropica]